MARANSCLLVLCIVVGSVHAQEFIENSRTELPQKTGLNTYVLASDFDCDGNPDLVLASRYWRSQFYLGLRDGRFQAAALPDDGADSFGMVALDVDSDGDIDLYISKAASSTPSQLRDRLFINDGRGHFADESAKRLPVIKTSGKVFAADVDGDGDVDLFHAQIRLGRGLQDQLWLNNGKGVFADATATHLPKLVDDTIAAAFGDVDGDGDLDLVVGCNRTTDRLYLNQGKGVYKLAPSGQFPSIASLTSKILLHDFDADGDPDAVITRPFGKTNYYENVRRGFFIDKSSQIPGTNWLIGFDAHVGDYDEDGDPDVYIGDSTGPGYLWLNDGKGRFTDVTAQRLPPGRFLDFESASVDIDQDGDLDFVLIGADQNNSRRNGVRVYLNRLRQVDAPKPPKLGQGYMIEFSLDRSFAQTGSFVVPLVSFRELKPGVTIPGLGMLMLDPALMILGPPLTPSVPVGQAWLRLPIPNLASLVGQTLYTQGLGYVPRLKQRWNFTNRIADRIGR